MKYATFPTLYAPVATARITIASQGGATFARAIKHLRLLEVYLAKLCTWIFDSLLGRIVKVL